MLLAALQWQQTLGAELQQKHVMCTLQQTLGAELQ